jgi:hypothetical protein
VLLVAGCAPRCRPLQKTLALLCLMNLFPFGFASGVGVVRMENVQKRPHHMFVLWQILRDQLYIFGRFASVASKGLNFEEIFFYFK